MEGRRWQPQVLLNRNLKLHLIPVFLAHAGTREVEWSEVDRQSARTITSDRARRDDVSPQVSMSGILGLISFQSFLAMLLFETEHTVRPATCL